MNQVPHITQEHLVAAAKALRPDAKFTDLANKAIELAPADQQPWMVRHGTNPVDIFAVKGIVVQSKYVNGDMFVFKVTGIAKGYELC